MKTISLRVPASLLVSLLGSSYGFAALTVVDAPGNFVGPNTPVSLVHSNPVAGVDTYTMRLDDTTNGSFFGTVSGAAEEIFRSGTDTSTISFIDNSQGPTFYTDAFGTQQFNSGAEAGDNNWLYFSRNDGPVSDHQPTSWVQVSFTTNSFTVLRYVHDPANPTADFTLAQAEAAVNGVPEPSSSALLLLGGLAIVGRRRK